MVDPANREQAEYWARQADPWIRFESEHERVTSLFNRALSEGAAAKAGDVLLDIGCGTGPTSLAFAEEVGPDGSVVGVDIAPAMLDRARQVATAKGVGNVTFRVADAQADDLGDGRFDVAVSRFGVMFFSDPVAAFTNIRSALKPGGRLACVCFRSPPHNEWMALRAAATEQATGRPVPPAPPGAPGPFSLADRERTTGILEQAGFDSVRLSAESAVAEIPVGEIDRYAESAVVSGPMRQALVESSDPTMRQRLTEAFRSLLEERIDGGRVPLRATAWLVTARR